MSTPNSDAPTMGIGPIRDALAAHEPNTAPSSELDRNASVAIILREGPDSGLEALFIKRAEHPGDPWSGHMALPGGRVETEDATLSAAAIRETEEEVGILIQEEMRIGRLDDVYGGRLVAHRLSVSPFVYYHPDPPEPTPNHEVAATVWVPLDHIADITRIAPYVHHADPIQRKVPSIEYEGYNIWGLTYRIMGNFVELFGVSFPGEPNVKEVEWPRGQRRE